jgi:putative ABC transport system permease protein
MGVIMRGIKNAFRNLIRTGSIIVILGLSIGMSLVMFLALTTIQTKIDQVKASIGNTITISPAGARGFEGGGEPLTEDQMNQVTSIAHVVSIDSTLEDRLSSDNSSLESAIEAGTLGRRFVNFNNGNGSGSAANFTPPTGTDGQPRSFTPPITVTGTDNLASIARSLSGSQPTFTAGAMYDADSTDNVAVMGKSLAAKNSLSVGSTFTAYNTAIKVVGIFDAGNTFANSGLAMPLTVLQKLSGQDGQVSSATVTVDSISNLSDTTKAVADKLGDKADVVSTQDTSEQALTPLQNIRTISLYSLIGSLIAGAVIIFMTMLMIVRERRREIGVLKAIGAGNGSIVAQFVSEAATFTVTASLIGIMLGVLLSNPVLGALSSNASSDGPTTTVSADGPASGGRGGFGGQFRRVADGAGQGFAQFGNVLTARQDLSNLHVSAGWQIIGYGLAVALAIAVIGSAIPAYMTAKVRPAEVLRSE